MTGRIRQEDIEAVRERTDIAKVVGQYLTLKKAGHDSMVGLCPFHTEKTASFSISPSKGVYYCFGCGAGGDAVRFLQQVEHLDFREAIERLAAEAGVELRFEAESSAERRAASRRSLLHAANEAAADLYHRMLLEGREGTEARAYLEGRGFDPATAEAFGIGYAPRYPDFLLRRLAPRFSPDLLIDAGLAVKDEEGGVRDRFRGRITFPVHDLAGKSVGFGARVLPSDRPEQGPKYLNSPETAIYRKGEMLYNLNRAKGAVSRSGEAVVVEGYTDVIALAAGGVETAVATCGTALGEGHFRLLSRFAQRVVLAFDSDEAGARAAERAYGFHQEFPLQPVVLILPEGLDPADLVRDRGAAAFAELAGEARSLVEYMLRRSVARHDLVTVDDRSRAVAEALPIVAGLADPVRRGEYAHLLSELAGVSEGSVLLALERSAGGRAAPAAEVARATKKGSIQGRVEREMLKLLARNPEVLTAYAERLDREHFQAPVHRRLYEAIAGAAGDVRALVAEAADDELAARLSALALEPLEGEPGPHYAEGVWGRLEEFALRRKSEALRQRLQKLNPQTDTQYDELFQELIGVDGELRRLKQALEGV